MVWGTGWLTQPSIQVDTEAADFEANLTSLQQHVQRLNLRTSGGLEEMGRLQGKRGKGHYPGTLLKTTWHNEILSPFVTGKSSSNKASFFWGAMLVFGGVIA